MEENLEKAGGGGVIYYSWNEFHEDATKIAREMSNQGYSSVFGVPRGGIPLALKISHLLDIPIVEMPDSGTLIVDDIIDSGATRRKYEGFTFRSIHSKKPNPEALRQVEDWVVYPWETQEAASGEDIVIRMLEFIGEDPTRSGLIDTPGRVTKMWKELFKGYDDQELPKITVWENGKDGIFYEDAIIDRGYFFSHCEHHMVPFFGQYYFGYIPDGFLIGASKIARVIDHFSSRLQVAERLVHDVVQFLDDVLKPKGLILIMNGRHLCKEIRGVRKYDSSFEVIAVRGCYFSNEKGCKEEFIFRAANGGKI
jgi:GTP cyclohydrolase I